MVSRDAASARFSAADADRKNRSVEDREDGSQQRQTENQRKHGDLAGDYA